MIFDLHNEQPGLPLFGTPQRLQQALPVIARRSGRQFTIFVGVTLLLIGCAPEKAPESTSRPTATDHTVEALLAGSAMHGVHGLAFNADDELFGASLMGYSIYRIDRDTGEVTTEVGHPSGNSDDLAFGPDGMLAWTAGAFSAIYGRKPGGEIRTLAEDLAGVNSINFSPDGRLFITRVFGGDHLYEIDTDGEQPPRLIARKLGGLNGFEITAENKLYGPLFFKGKVVEVDLGDGTVRDIADGFTVPAAVNFDQRGNLFIVDYATGEVTRIRMSDRQRTIIATLEPPLDNLAIDKRGFVYVSNPAFNRITEINPDTGETREVVGGRLSSPGDIQLQTSQGDEALFIADMWGNRTANPDSGELARFPPPAGVTASSSIAVADNYYAVASIWPFGVVYLINRATNELLKRAAMGAPYGMVFLDDGSLIIADYKKNHLMRLGPGKSKDKNILLEDLNGPVGLALHPTGRKVFFSEFGSGQVIEFDLDNRQSTVVMTGLLEPEGLAFDQEGNLLVAETGKNRIWSKADGKEKTLVSENIPMGLLGGDELPAPFLPTGIAVDQQDRIFVSSDIENAIYRLTPD
jgi:sugar lactone lactonase YvrE